VKAISPEPDGVTSSSRWLGINDEGMFEASSGRPCQRWLTGRPKRDWFQTIQLRDVW
jgi:hypothetical protein